MLCNYLPSLVGIHGQKHAAWGFQQFLSCLGASRHAQLVELTVIHSIMVIVAKGSVSPSILVQPLLHLIVITSLIPGRLPVNLLQILRQRSLTGQEAFAFGSPSGLHLHLQLSRVALLIALYLLVHDPPRKLLALVDAREILRMALLLLQLHEVVQAALVATVEAGVAYVGALDARH